MFKEKVNISNMLTYQDNFIKNKHVESICLKKGAVINPDISLVIPTFKRTDLLKSAIDSILNQKESKLKYEIIIVDNNPSRDCNTEKLINQKYSKHNNLSYYKNIKNIGVFGNWNRCYELASSDWVSMLHDDDELKTNYLTSIESLLHKNIVLIGNCPDVVYKIKRSESRSYLKFRDAIFFMIKSIGRCLRGKFVKLSIKDFIVRVPICPVGFVLKKNALFKVGGFGLNHPAEDYACFAKIISKYPKGVCVLDESLALYNVAVNETLNIEKSVLYEFNFRLRKILIDQSKLNYVTKKLFYSVILSIYRCEKSSFKILNIYGKVFFESFIYLFTSYSLRKNRFY